MGRQTVQQTDGRTDRKLDRVEQDSQTNKQTEKWAQRQTLDIIMLTYTPICQTVLTYTLICLSLDIIMYGHMNRHMDRQSGGQMDTWTDIRTQGKSDRHAVRQSD